MGRRGPKDSWVGVLRAEGRWSRGGGLATGCSVLFDRRGGKDGIPGLRQGDGWERGELVGVLVAGEVRAWPTVMGRGGLGACALFGETKHYLSLVAEEGNHMVKLGL